MTNDELTLDPADWDAFRALAHRMVDDTLAHLASLHDQPAWRPMPDAVRDSFAEPLPMEGVGAAAAYEAFAERVRPYPNGNFHPRFWGWVQGTGTPLAMMAEMLAAALNPHLAGFNQAPKHVEEQVIAWLAEMMGFPATSTGVLVAGGTMANVLGLAVARHAQAGFDIRAEVLSGERLGGADDHLPLVGQTLDHVVVQRSQPEEVRGDDQHMTPKPAAASREHGHTSVRLTEVTSTGTRSS